MVFPTSFQNQIQESERRMTADLKFAEYSALNSHLEVANQIYTNPFVKIRVEFVATKRSL